MTYEELLNSPLMYLPYTQSERFFKNSIQKLLKEYLEEVRQLPDGPMNIEELDIQGTFVKAAQKEFITGLLEIIDIYHDGKPEKAFRKLFDTLNGKVKDFAAILKVEEFLINESFYRMRLINSNFPLPSIDMFHIPFEKRGIIETQRYSIPGFPCLYIGRTLYGCWEEMSRPEINRFQVVRLKNSTPIRYLDLTRPAYGQNLRARNIYRYFMTWPLIACCSVIVRDYAHPFKSEYIIPQLLLQWIREDNRLAGIRFNSTHIDVHRAKSVGDFSNIVLPVKVNQEEGHCPVLKKMFEMTGSISWQLHEHAIGGQVFVSGSSDVVGVNSRITKLELIEGRVYPYNYSVLGKLESYLDGMPTSPL